MTTGTSAATSMLLVERGKDGVVRLTLNRPEKRNALSRAMLGMMEEAIATIANDTDARAVVIAAEGPVFCSGHDLSEMIGRSEGEYRDLFEACSRVMLGLRSLPQPVIARVQGVATAAGCQLVAACDLAVAAERGDLRHAGRQDRPLLHHADGPAGAGRARQGRDGDAPHRRGDHGRARERTRPGQPRSCRSTNSTPRSSSSPTPSLPSSPLVLRLGKQAFYDLHDLAEAEAAYRRAVDVMTDNALRLDAQEGIAAFLEKRRPEWSGNSHLRTLAMSLKERRR